MYELFWGTGNWYVLPLPNVTQFATAHSERNGFPGLSYLHQVLVSHIQLVGIDCNDQALTSVLCSTYTRERAGTEYAAYGNYSDHCSDEIISLVTIATSESIGLLQMPSSFTFTETATDTATHSIPTSTIMAQCSSRETTVVSHTTIDGTVTTVPFITTLAPISSTNECDFDANTGNSRRKHNAAAIAGGVIGGVTSLTFLGIMCARCVRRRQRSRGDLVAIEDTDPPEISSGPLSYTQRSSIMPVRSDEQRMSCRSLFKICDGPDDSLQRLQCYRTIL